MILNKKKIYLAETDDFSPSVLHAIQKQFDLVTFHKIPDLKEILNLVDIFWFRLGYKINDKVLDQNSKCKYLVTPVTGIDHIDESLCESLGIQIICLRREYEFLKTVRATAEHTIALTLSLYRNMVDAIHHTRQGFWVRDEFRGHELYNKKVGIIGLGRLGNIVAGYYKAFGCEVGYYDVLDKKVNGFKKYISIDALLNDSDIVSIHVNYNQENHHFFNKNRFEQMKQGSIFINTSRGGLVDEMALLDVLKSKKIAGAALDVLQGEPDISDNVLIWYASLHPNLIITPHIGGNTYESFEKTETFIFDKLLDAIYANEDN